MAANAYTAHLDGSAPSDRAPRPICRSTLRHIKAACTEHLIMTGSLSMKLTPGAQARDWQQRWTQIQDQLKRVVAPHSEPMSGESIQAANHDLHSFFIQAYHLKDALIQASATTGISKSAIKDAITQNPQLALLEQVANLDKHGPPRSGDVALGKVSGVADDDTGWRLSLEIRHKGRTLDGLAVAREAVSAWDKQLRQWGLI